MTLLTNTSRDAVVAVLSIFRTLITTGAFGRRFPKMCADGTAIIGADEDAVLLAIHALIPGLPWTLLTHSSAVDENGLASGLVSRVTIKEILGLVQFCYTSCGKPIQREY